jgi:peptidyl-tRNA hydrolase, PTH1 family
LVLFCGLGNKGREYAYTRHNIGYLVIDRYSDRFHIPLAGKMSGCKVGLDTGMVLVKPQTFMNLSGGPVSALMKKMDVDARDLLLIHDDLDMDFGRIRIKWGGRDGGHKGVRSVAESLGTQLFHRLKIGIGRDPRMKPEEYVLTRFNNEEGKAMPDLLDTAVDALHSFIRDGAATAMSIYNKSPGL